MRISDWSSDVCSSDLMDTYMPMIGTAEVVAKRYNISREAQDEYSLQSQQRTAAAQAAGKFADEIVACNATMAVVNKETKEVSFKDVVADKDECNRPDTTLEGLSSLRSEERRVGQEGVRNGRSPWSTDH